MTSSSLLLPAIANSTHTIPGARPRIQKVNLIQRLWLNTFSHKSQSSATTILHSRQQSIHSPTISSVHQRNSVDSTRLAVTQVMSTSSSPQIRQSIQTNSSAPITSSPLNPRQRLQQLSHFSNQIRALLNILTDSNRDQVIGNLWRHCGSRQAFRALLMEVTQQNSLELIRAYLKDLEYKRVLDNTQMATLQCLVMERKQQLGQQREQRYLTRVRQPQTKVGNRLTGNHKEHEIALQNWKLQRIQAEVNYWHQYLPTTSSTVR